MPIPGYTAGHLVSLDQVRAFLNLSSTTHDAELTEFRDAAELICETYTGMALREQTYTETYDGGDWLIRLRHRPVVSVDAVTERGIALTAADYNLEDVTGTLVRLADAYSPGAWDTGYRAVSVTYTAGYSGSTVPADIAHAVLLQVKHLWETQRGPARVFAQGDDGWNPTQSYSRPRRVEELLAPYRVRLVR